MEVLILTFDAPLMSFGSVRVDQHNRTDLFPYRAMLTGLIANAVGWDRQQVDDHERLQARLTYAARRDRLGTLLTDYQTVDLGADGPLASNLAWTTRGRLEERRGGEASDGTHIRYRQYLADAILTVAVTLSSPTEKPTLEDVARALDRPARPLFLGRKCCTPSRPLVVGMAQAESLRAAIESAPRVVRLPTAASASNKRGMPAVWPVSDGEADRSQRVARVEDRDWENAIHVGRRFYVEGEVEPPRLGDVKGDEK